jgi:uncharacterized protein (DUF58 family)
VVFLLSDFVAPDYTRPLRVANRRHDLVAITITDPAEDEVASVGLVHFVDAETGRAEIRDTSHAAFRNEHRRQRAEFRDRREKTFRRYEVDRIDVRTDRPYTEPLVAFFRRRERELVG